MDTIHAEATPPGRGGISVVRISGPMARGIAEDLVGPLTEPRRAELRRIVDRDSLMDQALVVRFDAGASYTGEEVVEFHLHGAPVISRRVQVALRARGSRLAEPGEFTQRGFLNGKIDLAAAEGLADLLAAETEAQRVLALRSASGELKEWAEKLRAKLIRAGALVAASIDFADEDVPEDVPAEVFILAADVRQMALAELAAYPAAERIRAGFEVAIIGPPNAGKSSLLNAIAKRDIAIVTDVPGTTRDVLELRTDLNGLAVTFLDTAGLRETSDTVESIGVARARDRAQSADLRVHLLAGDDLEANLWRDGDITVRSKADLGEGDISAVTGQGVADLLRRIQHQLQERVSGAGLIARERQAQALTYVAELLDFDSDEPAELIAEHLRAANHRLRQLIGHVDVEDYLDEVFSSFCIGK